MRLILIETLLVLGLTLGALALSSAVYAQENPDAQGLENGSAVYAQDELSESSCPEGMVFIASTIAVTDPSGEPIRSFCMDIFEYPNIPGSMPNYNISWIEAQANCVQEGKRLCTSSEWVLACSGPSNSLYPYGSEYNNEACNTEGEWMMNGSRAVISGAFQGCRSGYGIMDMSGNLSEWTDDDGDSAEIYGGSFVSGKFSSCKSHYSLIKTQKYIFNGSRCCLTPTANSASTDSPR
ncbi:MAG: SUMF1/EgtB/PvdO family nonheme iron enzyme [Candidatus Coatesbacteria bacterium]|nr:SUMF1/EgtB/PvdO family nonheme iron enzyme [Candidatus Coatesbacteria bacterium]